MKKRNLYSALLLLSSLFFLTACFSSKSINGSYQAKDPSNQKETIVIKENKLSISQKELKYSIVKKGFEKRNLNKETATYTVLEINENYFSIIDIENETKVFLAIADLDEPLEGRMLYAMNSDKEPNYDKVYESYKELIFNN